MRLSFQDSARSATPTRRTRDTAMEQRRQGTPNLTEPSARAMSGKPMGPEENGTAEHVASFPPAHARNPSGGAYGSQEDADGYHLYFYPGQALDNGKVNDGLVQKAASTMDGHRLRPQDINPVIRLMAAKAARFYSRKG